METNDAVAKLAALAQGTRLSIFRLLVEAGPDGVAAGEIAQRMTLAAATLSFHLKALAQAGLISARQEGRFIFYAADFSSIGELLGYLTENCCGGKACLPAPKAARSRKGHSS